MEESLPFDVFIKVLEVMSEFDSDISQSPPSLFHKLSKILDPWPELIQGFAPFLMPIQANKCGLVSFFHGKVLVLTVLKSNFSIKLR